MNRATVIMQAFRKRFEYWAPRIKKVALLTELEFIPMADGEFTVVARWKSKVDEAEYRTHFSRERVFGPYLTSPRQRPCRRPCDFRDDFIRDVLTQRGIR